MVSISRAAPDASRIRSVAAMISGPMPSPCATVMGVLVGISGTLTISCRLPGWLLAEKGNSAADKSRISAGIYRHGTGNERVLRERNGEPNHDPESCAGRRRAAGEPLTGHRQAAYGAAKSISSGTPT